MPSPAITTITWSKGNSITWNSHLEDGEASET